MAMIMMMTTLMLKPLRTNNNIIVLCEFSLSMSFVNGNKFYLHVALRILICSVSLHNNLQTQCHAILIVDIVLIRDLICADNSLGAFS